MPAVGGQLQVKPLQIGAPGKHQNIKKINWKGGRHHSKCPMTPDVCVAPHQLEMFLCPSTSLKRVAQTATRGINNKYKLATPLLKKPPTSKPYIPPELGKSAKRLAVRANTVGFSSMCRGKRPTRDQPATPKPAPRSHTP